MPFDRPTLQTLRDRFQQDFLARTDSGDSVLRRSVENILSFVVPAQTHGLYGFLNYLQKQVIPSEESDVDTLLRWSDQYLTPPQKPAEAAVGDVTFTGTPATAIPIGTEIGNRDGATFTTDVGVVIGGGGDVTVAVTATEPGVAGNTLGGTAVFLSTPIVGIDSEATVAAAGLTGGTDEEDAVGIFRRLRNRLRSPPRGGSAGDFAAWALEVAGVSRAFEFNNTTASGATSTGFVAVVIVDDVSGPVPGAAIIDAAQANIDLKRPVMMGGAPVIGPTPQLLTLTWSALIPDTAPIRASLEAAVEDWVLTSGEPGLLLRQPDIENAAQNATGVTSVSLSSPTVDQDPGQFGMYTTFVHIYV